MDVIVLLDEQPGEEDNQLVEQLGTMTDNTDDDNTDLMGGGSRSGHAITVFTHRALVLGAEPRTVPPTESY